MSTLGQRIRAARDKSGLTLREVAERSGGVHLQTVWRIEADEQVPSAGLLRALCETLGASADELLGLPGRKRRVR